METALGMPWGKLVDPKSGSILFLGLKADGKKIKKVPVKDVPADFKRRLKLHKTFRPSVKLNRISSFMKELVDRPADVARRRLQLALKLSLSAGAETSTDDGIRWTDQGSFFADAAEGGDPVQRGVADCYFISALDAVAWSNPGLIIWGPPRSGIARTDAAGHERGSIRFSPGYYHEGDLDRAGGVVDSGPLWHRVTLGELLPTTPEGIPLYAHSSDAGETWPGLYEKAFAIWRGRGVAGADLYSLLGGGWCGEATRVIVGRDWHLEWWYNENESSQDIFSLLSGHTRSGRTIHPVTAWTYADAESFPDDSATRDYESKDIHYNHCYAILGWMIRSGTRYVVLRNPWGNGESTHERRAEGGRFFGLQLNTNGLFALPVGDFRRYFEGFAVAYP